MHVGISVFEASVSCRDTGVSKSTLFYIDDIILGILEKWESLVPGIIACFASLAGDKYNNQYFIYY